ncbi:hypothetical protein HY501_03635 [Candidatus Woesearchaeota archaeon]|nr:hypothetical protein [Candidatus Woesearchaeota archaeon]
MPINKYSAKIIEDVWVSPNVIKIRVDPGAPLDFQAGQFMMIYAPGTKFKKAYSIASPPHWKGYLDFLIEIKEGGQVSPHLPNLKTGTMLDMEGPYGRFLVERPLKKETTFIATGTGLAPFRSMVLALLNENPNCRITLLYGFRFPAGFLMKEELESWTKQYPNFRLIPTCSRPDEGWKGNAGRVTDYFKELSPTDNDVYLCGAPVMIEDTIKGLNALGFPKEAIHREIWG